MVDKREEIKAPIVYVEEKNLSTYKIRTSNWRNVFCQMEVHHKYYN